MSIVLSGVSICFPMFSRFVCTPWNGLAVPFGAFSEILCCSYSHHDFFWNRVATEQNPCSYVMSNTVSDTFEILPLSMLNLVSREITLLAGIILIFEHKTINQINRHKLFKFLIVKAIKSIFNVEVNAKI